MTQNELIEAVRTAVTEGVTHALVELRKDDVTKVSLMAQLVESAQRQLGDCQAELKALQSDMRSLTHEVINARTGGETWREVAKRYEQQRDELREQVAELTAEVAALKRGGA